MQHTGRKALVTGAASGIARTTALRLAREGASMALFDLNPAVMDVAAEIRAQGGQAKAWCVNVADTAAVETAVADVQVDVGVMDILVNGAAIVNHIASIAKMKPDAWMNELAVNLGGPFNLIRLLAPRMAEQGWGRIVNVSSGAARGGLFNQAGYVSSKSGLLGLTRNVTLEFARKGVTCNAILPGLIATEKVQAMPEAILEAGIAAAPARRIGTMDEVAALISFLCSDDAGYVNGADIDVSGGSHLNNLALGSRKENESRKA